MNGLASLKATHDGLQLSRDGLRKLRRNIWSLKLIHIGVFYPDNFHMPNIFKVVVNVSSKE